MTRKSFLLLALLWRIIPAVFSQEPYHIFGFERNQDVVVETIDGQQLLYPWLGGLNSVRFSEIDINCDGLKDLLIFEKQGNRILPFIRQTGSGSPNYRYAPEYVIYFPYLHDWAIFKDYNGDGKEDIFTYGLAGIKIYKNVSNNFLKFELITDQLTSFYYDLHVNIFATPDDLPVIEDLDGDGDLDVLNFWVLGKYVHYQRNMSMERYGDTEHLDFILADECWGNFSEAADNNIITLFTNCQDKRNETRHLGSSLLAHDFTGNGLYDLVIGDTDYPNLTLLMNGGTVEEPLMVSQTVDFPNAQNPVHLFSMPAVSMVDIDGDGTQEIIVSPSNAGLTKSQDINSVWRYNFNTATGQYELETISFLQEETIDVGSGAYPVLFDWNGDGLLDLFISNYGSYDSSAYPQGMLISYYSSSIAYFENVGTILQPQFKLITNDFGNLKQHGFLALYPAFGTLGTGNSVDMICGNSDGSILFFKNQAALGEMPQFLPPVYHYQNINVTNFSTPQLFDLDRDGLQDLVIGNRRGQIAYYKNVGTAGNPQFQLITTTLGNVDVRDFERSYFGYSVPCFFRHNEKTYLFCGSEQGEIFLYKDIDNNLSGSFERSYSLVESIGFEPYQIREGIRCAPATGEMNHNLLPDLFIGNWAGGLAYFKGDNPLPVHISQTSENIHLQLYPNPASQQFRIEISPAQFAQCTIYDMLGRVISTFVVEAGQKTIDVSAMTNGLYILKIETAQNVEVRKWIKN